ncbi:hypothetical protein BGY98DRAFT_1043177 [Russula aff. rugulosa BPL654]|nr:hypothetical protein BGY98DRAFT_1043177 [Russula aff. rugulosa BPL654]
MPPNHSFRWLTQRSLAQPLHDKDAFRSLTRTKWPSPPRASCSRHVLITSILSHAPTLSATRAVKRFLHTPSLPLPLR